MIMKIYLTLQQGLQIGSPKEEAPDMAHVYKLQGI